MPFTCKKLNSAALSCKARILPVRVRGAFMDKDFLYKLVAHGICQRVKILVLINQGYKFLC